MGKIDCSIIGKKFGRLEVIDFDHMGPGSRAYFRCICDCGNEFVTMRQSLISGNTTSCGCKGHEPRYEDLTGRRFNKLYVLNFDHMGERGATFWRCRCDCGNETVVSRHSLVSGHTKSCGCRQRDVVVTHGMSYDRLYGVWGGVKARCNNENHKFYHQYGGRGIAVCDEWENFENFRDWSLDNGYGPDLTIDRIDNDGDYSPENCRWVDRQIQANNRRSNRYLTYDNDTHTIAEWARLFDVNYDTLLQRINRGDMRDFEEYFGD